MSTAIPLHEEQFYHVYNRGNGGERLFREGRNYAYFLRLYARYVEPVAETFAYCLLSNHFHLLVRIRPEPPSDPSRAFANFFSTYTKAFNRAYDRTGSLFQKPFRRVRVDDDRYLSHLVVYIHRNPQQHGLVADFRTWPHSSYRTLLSTRETRLRREAVLGWFGGRDGFVAAHRMAVDEGLIEALVGEEE